MARLSWLFFFVNQFESRAFTLSKTIFDLYLYGATDPLGVRGLGRAQLRRTMIKAIFLNDREGEL